MAPQTPEAATINAPSPFAGVLAALGLPLPEGAAATIEAPGSNAAPGNLVSLLALAGAQPEISSATDTPARPVGGKQARDDSSNAADPAQTWIAALVASAAAVAMQVVPAPVQPSVTGPVRQEPVTPAVGQATDTAGKSVPAGAPVAITPASVTMLTAAPSPGTEMSTRENDISEAGPEGGKALAVLQEMQPLEISAASTAELTVAPSPPRPAHLSAALPHAETQSGARVDASPSISEPEQAQAQSAVTACPHELAPVSTRTDEEQAERHVSPEPENSLVNSPAPDPHAFHVTGVAKPSESPGSAAVLVEAPPASHTAAASAHESAPPATVSAGVIVEKLDSGPLPFQPQAAPPASHVHLQIQSSVLGPLDMYASLRQRALEAVIATARVDVHGTLSADLSSLQHRLATPELHTAHVELVLQNAAGDLTGEHFSQGHQGAADSQSWRSSAPIAVPAQESEESPEAEPSWDLPVPAAGGSRLSVRA